MVSGCDLQIYEIALMAMTGRVSVVSAEVKEIVELYLYSPPGPSWPGLWSTYLYLMEIHLLLICNDRPYKFISIYGEKGNAYRILTGKLTIAKRKAERINKSIPTVTKAEECTQADTGVGAAIAAGNQEEKLI